MIRKIVTFTIAFWIGGAHIGFSQGYKVDPGQKQSGFQWPAGKKMAISLTFDDARLSQVDNCVPLLDKYRATGALKLKEIIIYQ